MLTCQEIFGEKVPPFLGNVRIVDFDLDKYIATYKEKVTATGKAEMKKGTPLNNWGPIKGGKVEIKIGGSVGRGKTDSEGRFSIDFTVPLPVGSSSYKVVAHLPQPEGGVPSHHLSCGPIGLTVVPEKEDAKAKVIGL